MNKLCQNVDDFWKLTPRNWIHLTITAQMTTIMNIGLQLYNKFPTAVKLNFLKI